MIMTIGGGSGGGGSVGQGSSPGRNSPPPTHQKQSPTDEESPRQPAGTCSGVDPKFPPPPPPPTEGSPSRRIDAGVMNVPAASPQRREKSPAVPPDGKSIAPKAVQQPPQMIPMIGVPGLSAFNPYPKPSSVGGAGTVSSHSAVGLDLSGLIQVSVPAGGSGSETGSIAARAEGSPASRKRAREAAAGVVGGGGGGGHQGEGGENPFACSICRRSFTSAKALFGHMRSHPNRGWKGAYPPSAFSAQEEFSDVPGLNRPPASGIVIREGVDQPQIAAAGEGRGSPQADQPRTLEWEGGTSAAAAVEVEKDKDEKKYPVPDLNQPPPNPNSD